MGTPPLGISAPDTRCLRGAFSNGGVRLASNEYSRSRLFQDHYKTFAVSQASPLDWSLNMSIDPSLVSAEPDWAAFAAIDWGSQKHFWALRSANGDTIQSGILLNTPEAVAVWASDLRELFQHRPIALALEQKRGAVIYMLSQYPHFVLYPIPPSMSAYYRQAFFPSGAKDDPGDAALLLDLLVNHRSRLSVLRSETDATRLLQSLVETRRQLIQQKVCQVQRLIDCLQQYFPQVRTWFDDLDTPIVADLLHRWPTLPELQHTHSGTLRRFFRQHHSHSQDRNAQRIQAIYAAVAATVDPVVIETGTRKTNALLHLIADLRAEIALLEKRIREIVATHPDAPIFASFPGAGEATVPRLIAAFGTNREAFSSAADVQCLSGIAPVLKRSGNSSWIGMRRACSKFLRQTFHEFAGQSIPFSDWAKAFYRHQIDVQKASHHQAVRALAFKWIRILYRCWKDRILYNEQTYAESRRRRRALVGTELASLAELTVENIAGFKKISRKKA